MTLCSLSFASETFELKEGAKCADKCAVRTDRAEATWGFGLGLLELEAPVGSSHAENRICHRTPEVMREEAVAHSTRGKRSSLISEYDSPGWLLLLKVVTALQDVSWGELWHTSLWTPWTLYLFLSQSELWPGRLWLTTWNAHSLTELYK